MRTVMMVFGFVRTMFGRDYRSRGKRRDLRRMGREFLRESFDRFRLDDPRVTRDELESHSNAKRTR